MLLMAGEGVKRCVTWKFKAGDLRLGPGILRLEARLWKWPQAARIGGDVVRLGIMGGEKKGLTCGAHMLVTREEKRRNGGMCKPERKAPFSKCAKAT
jgi:hypothetical protein